VFKGIYSLQIPGKVIAGVDSIESMKDIIKEEKVERALIITDKGVWNAGLVEKPIEIIKSCGCKVEIINNTPPEPEASQIEEIFNSVKSMECQMIIGIGGGSSMDTAKIISVLMTNDSNIREILGTDRIKSKGIPTLMIPTTAGTGSEATPNAIVLVPEEKLKIGIVSNKLIPDYVILDPRMTVKLPPAITANTGMDALIHAMECYISLKANPFSDTFALKAIKLISSSIRRAFNNGEDIDARHDMLIGSFYGGVSIAASGTTAVHALSYPLGSMYRIPHGLSNAILLPYVMEFNMDAAVDRYKDMAGAMGLAAEGLSSEKAAEKMVESLYALIEDLNIKSPLKEMNISESELDEIVESASKVTRLLDNNPKKLSKEDMRKIYKNIL
jgi:alcohol dehydrogenase class IV